MLSTSHSIVNPALSRYYLPPLQPQSFCQVAVQYILFDEHSRTYQNETEEDECWELDWHFIQLGLPKVRECLESHPYSAIASLPVVWPENSKQSQRWFRRNRIVGINQNDLLRSWPVHFGGENSSVKRPSKHSLTTNIYYYAKCFKMNEKHQWQNIPVILLHLN